MNLIDAKETWKQQGGDAVALLETARTYADDLGYVITASFDWRNAELLLHAIAGNDGKIARDAFRLWQTSLGASGRAGHQPPERAISVTEAAEAAGVTRGYIKAEIAAGRLPARRNATDNYEIAMADFQNWLANPRRGSRKKSE